MINIPALIISLRGQTERQIKTRLHLEKKWSNVNFLIVKRHEKGGKYGCFDSHIIALRALMKETSDFVAIFEDDVTPTEQSETDVEDVIHQFANAKHDMCYLGSNNMMLDYWSKWDYWSRIKDRNLVEMRFTGTHAIIYRRKSIPKILRILETHIGNWDEYSSSMQNIDQCITNTSMITMVGAFPMLYDQDRTFESTNDPWCKDVGDLCDRLKKQEHIAQSIKLFRDSQGQGTYVHHLTIFTLFVVVCSVAILFFNFNVIQRGNRKMRHNARMMSS